MTQNKTNEIILIVLDGYTDPIALYINGVLRMASNICSETILDLIPQGEYFLWESRKINPEWAGKHYFYQSPDFYVPSRLTDIPFEAFKDHEKWKLPYRPY